MYIPNNNPKEAKNVTTYCLMNKNREVAIFQKEKSLFGDDISFQILGSPLSSLPIGFSNITSWIEGRKASKHNAHLKEIMERLGCAQSEGFIDITHATSINDTFWVKKTDESLSWSDVSLYQNEFTESISALALAGFGLFNEEFSPTALPEFVSDGSFPKCFARENGQIYIYKGARIGYDRAGLEPYSEMLASEIARHITQSAVYYDVTTLHDKLASKCELFTGEEVGYAPFKRLISRDIAITLDSAFRYFSTLGSEELFREMLIVDALTFNTDRHPGNYGVLFQNDTLEVLQMAPVFDLNLSLFPYFLQKEFCNIGDSLLGNSPALGSDFTRIGQESLTERMYDRVRDLCDFQFTFRGDDVFSKERVKTIEEVVSKQAQAILSKEKLRTRDIFIPETSDMIKIAVKDAEPQLDAFASEVEALGLPIFVSIDADSHRAVVLVEPQNPNKSYLLEFDFLKQSISVQINFQEVATEKLNKIHPALFSIYKKLSEVFQKYAEERPQETEQKEIELPF